MLAESQSISYIVSHPPQHKLQKVPPWHIQSPKIQFPQASIPGAHCPTKTFKDGHQIAQKGKKWTCATSGPPESPWQASIPSSPAQIMLAESEDQSMLGYNKVTAYISLCIYGKLRVVKKLHLSPIAPLYALLQSWSLCIGTRAFKVPDEVPPVQFVMCIKICLAGLN